jgi:hypothetical protein
MLASPAESRLFSGIGIELFERDGFSSLSFALLAPLSNRHSVAASVADECALSLRTLGLNSVPNLRHNSDGERGLLSHGLLG